MCEAATPSPIAASAVSASGKATAAAMAKPTMSFRSILHFLLFETPGDAHLSRRKAAAPGCPFGHLAPDP
jgi:hypothetical protein